MDLKNICKEYFNYMLKTGKYTEDELDECLRFHLHHKIENVAKVDEKFLELEVLVGDSKIYCPKNHKDVTLCSYEEIFDSCIKKIIFDFLKEGKV
ncbi:hypothetical protein CL621_00310 [archaeon]|nr:hypothetical protein [archaeon]|tara:strand:+ start:117 stop:401 length:285 start_codon:yes stop_codon:yes gene_type:complete